MCAQVEVRSRCLEKSGIICLPSNDTPLGMRETFNLRAVFATYCMVGAGDFFLLFSLTFLSVTCGGRHRAREVQKQQGIQRFL